MFWLKMGWRNLWRNRGRTFLQVLAIAGGLMIGIFFRNLAAGSYEKMIFDGTRSGSGHVGLYHQDYFRDRKTISCFSPAGILARLQENPMVRNVFPRLIVPGLIQSSRESNGTLLLGLDIETEKTVNPLLKRQNLTAGTFPVGDQKTNLLIGSGLAQRLQVKVGNKLVVTFQDAEATFSNHLFRVAGIFHTGITQFDRDVALVDRQTLAKAFGKTEVVHEIAVVLEDRHTLPEFLNWVRGQGNLPGQVQAYPWMEAMPELYGAIRLDGVAFEIMMGILFFLIGIGTVNTLLMSVTERTREFGLLRALGLNSSGIQKTVFAEALVLGILGVTLGVMLGCAASSYTYRYGLDLSRLIGKTEVAGILVDPLIFSIWDLSSMTFFAIVMMIMVVLTSIYPTHRALKIRPAEAMRQH